MQKEKLCIESIGNKGTKTIKDNQEQELKEVSSNVFYQILE